MVFGAIDFSQGNCFAHVYTAGIVDTKKFMSTTVQMRGLRYATFLYQTPHMLIPCFQENARFKPKPLPEEKSRGPSHPPLEFDQVGLTVILSMWMAPE